ncbi:MAG: hypothetical protein HKN70_00770 [Gammaproteobacteria bacterium]|nr:hypothetical protein [Gammaproteobacteria bacterium]
MVVLEPVIGQWYLNRSGDVFEVVAIDSVEHTIELQYFDGTVDEIDGERWALEVSEEIQPPEDYSGSLDITADDYEMSSQFIPKQDYQDPLDYIDIDYVEPE